MMKYKHTQNGMSICRTVSLQNLHTNLFRISKVNRGHKYNPITSKEVCMDLFRINEENKVETILIITKPMQNHQSRNINHNVVKE